MSATFDRVRFNFILLVFYFYWIGFRIDYFKSPRIIGGAGKVEERGEHSDVLYCGKY